MFLKTIRGYAYFRLYEHLIPYVMESDSMNYDGCFDCNLEIAILADYFMRRTKSKMLNNKRDALKFDMDAIEKVVADPKTGMAQQILTLKGVIDYNLHNWSKQCSLSHGALTQSPKNPRFYIRTQKTKGEFSIDMIVATPTLVTVTNVATMVGERVDLVKDKRIGLADNILFTGQRAYNFVSSINRIKD